MAQVAASPELKAWLEDIRKANRRVDLDYLSHAYRFTEQAHREQHRRSGEQYLTHPMAVALELAVLHLDTSTVAAGLLHDVLEDSTVTKEQLTEEFGDDVAFLVEGVTKISGLEFRSKEDVQAENFRKMLLSMAQDLRVILIKLADRLHNMRTLEHLDRRKANRIAQETLDIYAPLAHRFGIHRIKTELEDLALEVQYPKELESLKADLQETEQNRKKALDEVRLPIQRALKKGGIKADITWRHKSYFSIHKKMERQQVGLEDIYDLVALRIITREKSDCYHALGVVHDLFVPISHRFKDFIANPKNNLYQSIHTTVVGPEGESVEIQIRTREMHRTAEEGIAAHWKYKSGKAGTGHDPWDDHVRWVREMIELQMEMPDAREFMENLKLELFENEVYVFTPQGDVIRLPVEATPLDFAFGVHSDVGLHCQGAKIDGRIAPLHTKLKSGNTVEILTSAHQHPNQSWLRMVKTSKARSNIKRYLKEQQAEQSIKLGQELLEREVKRARLKMAPRDALTDLAQSFGFEKVEGLYEALGTGSLAVKQVISKLQPPEEEERVSPGQETFVQRLVDRARSTVKGVSVQGEGNMMINFAQCCQPIPGDRIVGYVTRGRGVSIHTADCLNLANLLEDPSRLIEVAWDTGKDQSFLVGISVIARDRVNLLGEISRAIASLAVNIRSANIETGSGEAVGRFILEVRNLQHLQRVLKRVKKVKGVDRVERIKGSLETV
jgi:GTP pyrophosphokinase